MGVAIHPEKQNDILRPVVEELVQLDLPFLSYGQITIKFYYLKNNGKKRQLFGYI